MRILFVCTGNTCRSPLAEVIARREVATRGWTDVQVSSAGTNAWPDAPASDGSLLVALEHDMDLSTHRARVLSPSIVASSDVILTMGPHHREQAESMGGAEKSWLLTAYANPQQPRAISDPFGGDLEVYRDTYNDLVREIGSVMDRLASQRTKDTR